jgi:hypothetical protein
MVTLGWIAVRIASQTPLLPPPPLPVTLPVRAATAAPIAAPAALRLPPHRTIAVPLAYADMAAPRSQPRPPLRLPDMAQPPSSAAQTLPAPPADGMAALDMMQFIDFSVGFANRHLASDHRYMAGFQPTGSPPPLFTPAILRRDRWRASAWLLWRQGSALAQDAVAVGRLGGSQAGVRVDYDVTPRASARAAPYARLTSALQRPAAPEAAIGLSLQPDRAIPVTLAIERRVALGDGARNANAAMAVGGFGPKPVAAGWQAEGYAQAGVVGFRRGDLFADGKTSLLRPLSGTPVRIGASLSGGAQPGASRLDIGPEVQVRLPLPHIPARLSIEWRHRIAGDARPSSGLAVTLGADF